MSNVSSHLMHSSCFAALAALLVSGCATDTATYSVGKGAELTRAGAEAALAERVSSAGSAKLDSPLKAISMPFPEYPQSFRDANIVGSVRVSFTIEADGTVSNPTVRGSPPPPLVAITLHAILRWRFEPPMRGGHPTKITATQEFGFRLQ